MIFVHPVSRSKKLLLDSRIPGFAASCKRKYCPRRGGLQGLSTGHMTQLFTSLALIANLSGAKSKSLVMSVKSSWLQMNGEACLCLPYVRWGG